MDAWFKNHDSMSKTDYTFIKAIMELKKPEK